MKCICGVLALTLTLLLGISPSEAAEPVLAAATANVVFELSGDPDDNVVSIFVQRGPTVIAKIEALNIRIERRTVHKVPLKIVQEVSRAGVQHGALTFRLASRPPAGLRVTVELEMQFVEEETNPAETTVVKKTMMLMQDEGTSQRFQGSW
jgi:hypothetical protein